MNLDKLSQDRLIDIGPPRQDKRSFIAKFSQLNAADVEIKSSLTDLVTVADKASEAFYSPLKFSRLFPELGGLLEEEAVAMTHQHGPKIATAGHLLSSSTPFDGLLELRSWVIRFRPSFYLPLS